MCEADRTEETAGGEPPGDWEDRVAAAWDGIDAYVERHGAAAFRALIDGLAADLPAGSAAADFERACAFDSTGHPESAAPLYTNALRTGLRGVRRKRAVIQLASTLRNLGRAEESVALLTPELPEPAGQSVPGQPAVPRDPLDDAVRATLALALADLGRAREGVGHALTALAPHLPRYQRSMARYARQLTEPGDD